MQLIYRTAIGTNIDFESDSPCFNDTSSRVHPKKKSFVEWSKLFYTDSTHDFEVTEELLKPHIGDTDGEDIDVENEDQNQRLKDQSNRSNFYKVKICYYINGR